MLKLYRKIGLVPMAFTALSALASGPALARTCDLDEVPAATLLLPYFEVDVSAVTPPLPPRTVDTLFGVLNTSALPRIAHVTLWTDWAIPTVSFDLALGAFDEQSINVIDLLVQGAPKTNAVAGCTGALVPGTMYFNPALPVTGELAKNLDMLRKAHSGLAMDTPTGPKVASSSHPGLAKGYITIDVVRRCTKLFPSSPQDQGYFRDGGTGIATNDNVLTGDYFLADSVLGAGIGEPMVHIRADRTFQPGNYTFYGRYVGGKALDDRQPLGSMYANRFWTGFPPNPAVIPQTFLIVWRDTKSAAPAPFPVGSGPAAIPLSRYLGCDEDRSCSTYPGSLPLATQRTAINLPGGLIVPYTSGWMRLNLNYTGPGLFRGTAQGYVTTIFGVNGVIGVSGNMAAEFRASRLQTPCKP